MPVPHSTPIFRSPLFMQHDTGDHVEHPRRIEAIDRALASADMLVDRPQPEFVPAEMDAVARVHDEQYLEALLAFSRDGGGWIDNDTFCGPDSVSTALLAAGAAIGAVDAVLDGPFPHAFSLGRPPGHHATPNKAMGFCLINNVAVAAAHALERGLQRVAIIDWDVHHGNGTQDIFYDIDDVLFCSVHQYGLFYPGTGGAQERGAGHGAGHTINVPLSAGQGDRTYLHVMDEIFHLPIQEFHPELILISAGFDAHEADPLGGMAVTDRGFARLADRVAQWADDAGHNRVVAVLEGGYHPSALGRSVVSVLDVLDGCAVDRYDGHNPAQSDR